MEHIKINLVNPVYGVREMPIHCFFIENNMLKIVFVDDENHKMNIGQHLTFVRYIYDDNDISTSIQDNIEVISFDKYYDNGVEYDCVYTTIPQKRRLSLDRTTTENVVYWDKIDNRYVVVDNPTLGFYDYVFDENNVTGIDLSSLTNEEIDSLPEHLYTIEESIYGIRKFKTLFPAGTIPSSDILTSIIIEAMTNEGIEIPEEYLGDNIYDYIDEGLGGDNYDGMDSTLDHLYDIGAFDIDRYDEYFVLTFNEKHDIYQQDIDLLASSQMTGEYYINVYDSEMSKIGYFLALHIPYVDNLLPVDKKTTLTEWVEQTCGMFDMDGNPYDITYHKYVFAPNRFSKKSIIVRKAETGYVSESPIDTPQTLNIKKIEYLLEHGFWFEPAYTPFFYTTTINNSEWCTMWDDIWWDYYENNNGAIPQKNIWFNSGNTHVALTIDNSYWNVPTLFSSNDEFTSLNTDEDGVYNFIENTISNSLPKAIDFERVKYFPVIFNETPSGNYTKASEIIYRLHFRQRVKKNGQEVSNIPEEYRPYEDGWYVNQESGSTVWWNEMQYSLTKLTNSEMTAFVLSQNKKSDMLGYLNFNDDDVFFSKTKLTKSFVRFSFYTSKDPIEQKLLYYSTSFFDIHELRQKYIKLLIKNGRKPEKNERPFVLTDDNENRLDSTIKLTDEHNSDKSSDGFNIYLFLEDAPIENSEKTIYMKVEFNHAGNGKTIPMILWPKNNNGNYVSLTTSNFLSSLYIPIIIKYINGEYVYEIVGSQVNGDIIEVSLFEPKLDIEGDDFVPTTGNTDSTSDTQTQNT